MEQDYFRRHRPAFAKMRPFGFAETEGMLEYREDFMDGQFEALLQVAEDGSIRGCVTDLDTGEEYLPIRARDQIGGFVGSVREGYLAVLARIRDACFVPVDFMYDQANRIAAALEQKYGSPAEFPWEKYPGNGTFKCLSNGKWYAAILTVAFGKLKHAEGQRQVRPGMPDDPAHDADTIVEVINLKSDPDLIPTLASAPGIYTAWHMNKKHWLSVILDDTLTDAQLMALIDASFRLVEDKKTAAHVTGGVWMIPSNPKVYDIDTEFAEAGGVIEWHQHNNIRPGDEVYIYSAAPNSALMYRCEVEASDLAYHGMFMESKGYERAMRIRLIEKYSKEKFPLSFLKAHGGSAVRSARRMPQELLEAILKRNMEDDI